MERPTLVMQKRWMAAHLDLIEIGQRIPGRKGNELDQPTFWLTFRFQEYMHTPDVERSIVCTSSSSRILNSSSSNSSGSRRRNSPSGRRRSSSWSLLSARRSRSRRRRDRRGLL
jgi:hypothetical protein